MAKNSKPVVAKGLKPVAKPNLDPMQRIIESARQGKLVVVVGTGVSIGLTNGAVPSWTELIKNGFEYGKKKGRITDAHLATWSNQLGSTDMDDLLGPFATHREC